MTINCDARNKERALSRLRQLSSSALPLDGFIQSVFDLIYDAVPSSPNRAIHVGVQSSDAYFCATPEVGAITPLHNHYFVECGPPVSGAKFKIDMHTIRTVLASKTIWMQEEAFDQNFHRKEGFNEAYRPLGWHHCLGVTFAEPSGYQGYYGMWRGSDQKPFSREDIDFLRAAAPNITHGLKIAQCRKASGIAENFAPLRGWDLGVLLLEPSGRPIAMDSRATLIFQQLGVLDGLRANRFAAQQVRKALEYVARTLHTIFHNPDGGRKCLSQPIDFISTGAALRSACGECG